MAFSGSQITRLGVSGFSRQTYGVDSVTSSAVGSSAGLATVSGIGEAEFAGVGSSSGSATVSGVGASTNEATGNSAGSATVSGVGSSIAAGQSVGSSAGSATVSGIGASTVDAIGSASGSATVIGISGNAVPVEGGAKPRRRHRQFANIDGKLVEVASFKEAQALIDHFNKGKAVKKAKKRRLTFTNGPYVSVYDADAMPQREIKQLLKSYHDDEEMLLLLLMVA